jgi:hypothetical protein
MRARLRHHKRSSEAATLAPLCILLVIVSATPALAYRPFDGTDAAVADPNEMEIEFQPAGALWQGSDKSLVGPWAVLNFGFENRWEAVLEGKGISPLSPAGPFELTDAAFSLKHVLIPGSLQDETGPSVATEFGVLLPEVNGDSGAGASFTTIVSQRWDWGTIHFNAAAMLTRQQTGETFTSIIIEGPSKWTVRPVAEVFYEQEINQSTTISGLVGLIWQVRDNLSFDIAYRHALTDGHPVNEIRLGTTFGFPLRPMTAAHDRSQATEFDRRSRL